MKINYHLKYLKYKKLYILKKNKIINIGGVNSESYKYTYSASISILSSYSFIYTLLQSESWFSSLKSTLFKTDYSYLTNIISKRNNIEELDKFFDIDGTKELKNLLFHAPSSGISLLYLLLEIREDYNIFNSFKKKKLISEQKKKKNK